MSTDILSTETMLAASTDRSGLSEFGDPSFRQGLNLLMADIRALHLDPVAAQTSASMIGKFLDARAIAVKGFKERPDALARPIREPVVIAGLVRSGTTALHLLMSLDPQFQGPEHWLTTAPMPRPPVAMWNEIPEYRSEKAAMGAYIEAAPEISDDHMMTAEGIEESLFILSSGFASNMFPSMFHVPNYDRWYRNRDDTESYRWLADVLRLISADDDRRWLLKNPTDLFSLQELLTVFPDAKVIQTHRDPIDAIPSISSLIFSSRRAMCGEKCDPADVGQREMEMWAQALERANSVREKSSNVFVDVEFSAFTRNQMSTIRSIYEQLDLILTPETEAAMESWLALHPRRTSKGPKHKPEDYGLTPESMAARFAAYRSGRGYA